MHCASKLVIENPIPSADASASSNSGDTQTTQENANKLGEEAKQEGKIEIKKDTENGKENENGVVEINHTEQNGKTENESATPQPNGKNSHELETVREQENGVQHNDTENHTKDQVKEEELIEKKEAETKELNVEKEEKGNLDGSASNGVITTNPSISTNGNTMMTHIKSLWEKVASELSNLKLKPSEIFECAWLLLSIPPADVTSVTSVKDGIPFFLSSLFSHSSLR